MFAPPEGRRRAKVTDRRAAVDYAHTLKDLSDMVESELAPPVPPSASTAASPIRVRLASLYPQFA